MLMNKTVILLFFLLGRGRTLRLKCKARGTDFTDGDGCGSLELPCQAKRDDLPAGFLFHYRHSQLKELPDPGLCQGGLCEYYLSELKTFEVIEGSPTGDVDIEMSENGIAGLCAEACLNSAGGAFSGACQHRMNDSAGCAYPTAEHPSDDDLCNVELIGNFGFQLPITGNGECRSDIWWQDIDSPCTKTIPCYVAILNYRSNGGAVGDLVEVRYHQKLPDDSILQSICAGESEPACEDYLRTIYAWVVGGEPSKWEVEFSPAAMDGLCAGQCLMEDGTTYYGVCQQNPTIPDHTSCLRIDDTVDPCGYPMAGNLTYHKVVTWPGCDDRVAWHDSAGCGTKKNPCEAQFAGDTYKAGTFVQVNITQEVAMHFTPFCRGTEDMPCDEYVGSVIVKSKYGEPFDGAEVSFSPHALEVLCPGGCLDGTNGGFTGVCQSDTDDDAGCLYPGEAQCGVPLFVTYTHEALEDQSGGAAAAGAGAALLLMMTIWA